MSDDHERRSKIAEDMNRFMEGAARLLSGKERSGPYAGLSKLLDREERNQKIIDSLG